MTLGCCKHAAKEADRAYGYSWNVCVWFPDIVIAKVEKDGSKTSLKAAVNLQEELLVWIEVAQHSARGYLLL